MHNAYLGAGCNLGDRLGNLSEAVSRLHCPPHRQVLAVSSVYQSEPVGGVPQPDFLNLVVHIGTTLSPEHLLAQCLRIETEMGRVRLERWGPRTLDLDVLLYDNLALVSPSLMLPHPRMGERSFVLTPLAEIARDLLLGVESVASLAAKLDQSGLRKLGRLEWGPRQVP